MTAQQIASLVNIGAAGAVIAVVLIFLKFIEKRDKDWRDFFTTLRQADSEASTKLAAVIDRLAARVENLETKFDKHNAVEMEFLRGLNGHQGKVSQPPRKT